MSEHTKGKLHAVVWATSDEDRAAAERLGLQPIRMLHNDGSMNLSTETPDGEHKIIAHVLCQTPYKRGQGYQTECAERDANAARLVLAWNCHDELVEALERAHAFIRHMASAAIMPDKSAERAWAEMQAAAINDEPAIRAALARAKEGKANG